MTHYIRVRDDILNLYITHAVYRAAENWNMFQDSGLLGVFKDEIVDDVISDLKENGYLDD